MAQDQQTSDGRRFASQRIALTGMVVAAVLGAGLGVWARSAPMPEPDVTEPEPTLRPLQIVIEDTLPPIGQLLEVLPPELAEAAAVATPEGALAWTRPPASSRPLPVVALQPLAPADKAKPHEPKVKPAASRRVAERAAKPAKAKADGRVQLAKATAPKTKSKAASRKPEARLAEARPDKARKPAAAKAPTRLAKSAASKKAPVRVAKASPPKKAPPPARSAPRREEPLRVARNACALPDPGAALVCADQRLGARDRQLQRAYRRAEAAGVSTSALRHQESRWLDVRAAAAREAPWAVEDVYVARISEVNDMIRDAREN